MLKCMLHYRCKTDRTVALVATRYKSCMQDIESDTMTSSHSSHSDVKSATLKTGQICASWYVFRVRFLETLCL